MQNLDFKYHYGKGGKGLCDSIVTCKTQPQSGIKVIISYPYTQDTLNKY